MSTLLPPGPDKQGDALRATQFSPTTRYAVASRKSNTHTVPTHPIGDRVSAEIAQVVAQKLGIQVVAMSHAADSNWSRELARANDATGWIRMSDNEVFFRNAGFDGYVLVTLYEDIEYYDGPKGSGKDRKFVTSVPLADLVRGLFAERGTRNIVYPLG